MSQKIANAAIITSYFSELIRMQADGLLTHVQVSQSIQLVLGAVKLNNRYVY